MTKPNKEKDFDDDLYDEEDEDTQKDKFLTFRLADEEYGIDICHVTEIVGMQKITSLPDMPDYLKGMINLRGKVIPVIDVRTRFKLPIREYDNRTCIVVVNISDNSVGLLVDTVRDVANIPESEIEPPAKIQKKSGNAFIKGMGKVGDEVKILLDVNKLLFEEELEQIAQSGQGATT